MAELIALFPLTQVLVPGMTLRLHVFEPRYRRLLSDVGSGGSAGAFGVVLLRTGTEARRPGVVETRPDLAPLGTLAQIVGRDGRTDGATDLVARGVKRFRLDETILEAAPYPLGRVSWLGEPDGPLTTAQVVRARRLCLELTALLHDLDGRSAPAAPHEAGPLSYHIAGQVPLAATDRQRLLATPSTAQRLQLGARLLRREIVLLQRTRSIAVPAGAVTDVGAHLN